MSIQLIALDLDGTLLNSSKEITDYTIEVLNQAAKKGIYIVPSTGRSKQCIPKCVANLPFIRYALTLNGALVVDLKTDKIIHEYVFTGEEAIFLWDYIQKYQALPDCDLNGELYMERKVFERLPGFINDPNRVEIMKQTRKEIEDIRKVLLESNVKSAKMNLLFADMNERMRARADLESLPFVEVSSSLDRNLELNRKGGNKGNGLKALAKYLNLNINQVMALGDSDNDITMIETAGLGIAMANAAPEIIKVADGVTDSNDEDGVAHAIERWVLNT
ncbi:Cof-type HAD-IIB family hydrolase [Herbinix luporum]|nr:Cof-type HAD-IIB family hydrolase [Herbinix luporum]